MCDLVKLFQLLGRDALKLLKVLKVLLLLEDSPGNPQATYHWATRKDGTQKWAWCEAALQIEATQVCEDFPSSSSINMLNPPLMYLASPGPSTNWFSHFLLHNWSTSKTLIHSFCLHVAHHGLMTASIWFHWAFFFFFSFSQFKVWGKNPALFFLSMLCHKSVALDQEPTHRSEGHGNHGCQGGQQACQAWSLSVYFKTCLNYHHIIVLCSCTASHFRLQIKELYMSSMPRWNTG